ncbi:hypothetical protein [Nitrosomonas communis]|uniref:hypothetical protein n=1 Tax=Nitrosomonas communis TaxID=44574 RepID=UPI003D2825E4
MTKTELAKELGISRRMLYKLIDRGMPADSVEAAIKWRQQNLDVTQTNDFRIDGNPGVKHGKGSRGNSSSRNKGDASLEKISFNEARTEREILSAKLLALDLQERAGILFRGDKVENIIAQIARSFRDGLFVMAKRVSISVAAESDPARCEQMIVDGICTHIVKITDEFERNIKV